MKLEEISQLPTNTSPVMKLILTALIACFVAAALAAPRIFGGHNAPEGGYPYQVAVKVYGFFICGGSIINKHWILTAAHCVKGYESSALTVMIGSNQLNEEKKEKIYQVKYAVGHNDFNMNSHTHDDIGLIRVDREIEFSDRVQPISLTKSNYISKIGTPAVHAGWGLIKFNIVPNELQEITFNIFDHEKCESYWQMSRWPYVVGKNQICTLNKSGEGVCKGDSGGALVVDGVQIGIASYGQPCAMGVPDVFTNVYSYLDWINEHMEEYENSV